MSVRLWFLLGWITVAAAISEVRVTSAAPVLSFTGHSGIGVSDRMEGYTFSVNEIMIVNKLGLWDRNGDGNEESRPIGLWDSGGTLLTSVTMPAGTVGVLNGDFRYLPVTDTVVLTPGETYTVAAFYTTSAGGVSWEVTGLSTIPEFNFGTNRATNPGSGFVKPTAGFGPSRDPGVFGPTLDLATIDEAGRTPALAFTGQTGVGVTDRMEGYTFTVDKPMVVTDLGLWDRNRDGNEESRPIGLWDSSGALIASVTMPAGLVGVLDGDFRYMALDDPLVLSPGETYTVAAFYTTSAGGVSWMATGLTEIDGFNFGTNRATNPGSGFVRPTAGFGPSRDAGVFGPNLRFATPIPAPSGILLAMMAAAGLVVSRNRSDGN